MPKLISFLLKRLTINYLLLKGISDSLNKSPRYITEKLRSISNNYRYITEKLRNPNFLLKTAQDLTYPGKPDNYQTTKKL